MRNVTITLEESLARRARIEAAARGLSLSKFITGLVEREFQREALYAEREDKLH